jgi:hypothetical protein
MSTLELTMNEFRARNEELENILEDRNLQIK